MAWAQALAQGEALLLEQASPQDTALGKEPGRRTETKQIKAQHISTTMTPSFSPVSPLLLGIR